jgi:hypothetical protein
VAAASPAIADQSPKLHIQAQLALRYEVERSEEETLDELTVNRFSIEARGTLAPRLKYRAQADVTAKSARDLWISYDLSPNWLVKLGQHTVPFGLARFIGSPYRLFAELSVGADQFETPRGRGLGARLEGHGSKNQWSLEMGVYDGRGPLVARESETNGYLVGARAGFALAGEVVEEPTPFEERPGPDLVVAFGLMSANRNTQRDWAFGQVAPGALRTKQANFTSATADVFWRSGALHASTAAFARSVHPEGFGHYKDVGYEVQGGWVFTHIGPKEGELVLRASQLLRDVDGTIRDDHDLQNELGLALNWYQKGNRSKTQLNLLTRELRRSGERNTYFILQQQLRF